ncbi:MAG: hypothetical protein RLY71_1587 [Pseudomonadota bacterium]|jgi:hypothetical protein
MQIKSLIATAILAISGTAFANGAQLVSGPFDTVLESITVNSLSNVSGDITWGTGSVAINFGSFSLSAPLVDGTVASFNLGALTDQDGNLTNTHFSFLNVAPGTYNLSVTGNSSGISALTSTTTVTAVPEPETYAMMLAGLGALGFVGRRRKAK